MNNTGSTRRAQATELRHLDGARRCEVYIACADWNFAWLPEELNEFKRLWRQGVKLPELADRLRRPDYEIALLVMDMAERGEIEERRGQSGK